MMTPNINIRPVWDDYFLGFALQASTRATCPRRHVGAVLVVNKHIIATGYNGAPTGEPQCDEVGCSMVDGHCERTIHAELNTILQAAQNGVSVVGSIMYCTVNPCFRCRMYAKQAGVIRFVYSGDDYVDQLPHVSPL